jgi:hypothetical protein
MDRIAALNVNAAFKPVDGAANPKNIAIDNKKLFEDFIQKTAALENTLPKRPADQTREHLKRINYDLFINSIAVAKDAFARYLMFSTLEYE